MIVFLTVAYVLLLVVLTKIGLVPNSKRTWLTVIPYMLILLLGFFIPMQWGAPGGDVRTLTWSVPITPNVAGEVIEVAVIPNQSVKAGDVLFKLDPKPYQAALDGLEAQLQERLAEEALDLYERTTELVQAKFDVGQVTQKELSLARANVATGQVALRQARRGRQQAARALELMLGRYPAADIEGATDLVATPPPIPVGVPSELLERRPDMLAAERAVAAEFLQLESARAARLPRIGLTAGTGTSSTDLNDVLQLGSGYWSVGANFFAPLYQGGALQAQVEIETAQQESALASYGMAALQAFGEVEQGLDNESLLREQQEYLEVALSEASEALRIAQDQFDVGRVDLLSVLQQQGQVIGRARAAHQHTRSALTAASRSAPRGRR